MSSRNSPWDLITSLGVHFYTLDDEKLLAGNKACKIENEKRPCVVEENLDSIRDDCVCNASGCSIQFDSLSELESHQRARHSHVCITCKAALPSFHLLDRHIVEVHDSFFQVASLKKPMYVCLMEHCKEIFLTPLERKEHCVQDHKFPSDFRYDLQWRKLKPPKHPISDTHNKPKDKVKLSPSDDQMEASSGTENVIELPYVIRSTKKAKKVPKSISFGCDARRSFVTKSKHWHQKNKPDNSVRHIEQISMSDISTALEDVEAMES